MEGLSHAGRRAGRADRRTDVPHPTPPPTHSSRLSCTCAGCTSCRTRSLGSPARRHPSGAQPDSPVRAPSAPLSLLLTRKEIFIRYSTPSFSTKDCFLKLSRSPAFERNATLGGSGRGSHSGPGGVPRLPLYTHPPPGIPGHTKHTHTPWHPRPHQSQSLKTTWLHFPCSPQEGTSTSTNYF